MKLLGILAVVAAVTAIGSPALAQAPAAADKPSVGKYLADGYEVLRAEIGNPFLQFILAKKTATGQVLVWCSVQLQNGETTSCRVIK